ncbi:MAG: glycosyltransferase family 4 protein [Chloroflexi bacterium]|nr:glycosyltransferase family 4 protein [Chloroflexota bacterium]
MRVAIVIVSWGIGGSEKRYANIYNFLSQHSEYEYTLVINNYLVNLLQSDAGVSLSKPENVLRLFDKGFSKRFDRPLPTAYKNGGILAGIINFLIALIYQLGYVIGLMGASNNLRQQDFDVVHYVFPYLGQYLDFIIKKPKVLACQNVELKSTLLKNRFYKKALQTKGFFDIVSEQMKMIITEELAINDDFRLRVYPCSFVDYEKTYIVPKEQLITHVGRTVAVKNPHLFVEAINQVEKVFPQIKAYMLGRGILDKQIDELIERYELQNVITKKFHPQPEEVLSRSLVYVTAQSFDNYSNQTLREAMACGCAIVATDVGNTWRLVDEKVRFSCS